MKQILQSYKTGELELAEVPVPVVRPGMVLVQTVCSLISAGTERLIIGLAEKSMVGKARERPDLVRKVLDKARNDGVLTTVQSVFNKLDSPIPLGYSSAGVVIEVGEGIYDLKPGDRVAMAGAGYANHAEYNTVPRNLVIRMPKDLDFESAAFGTVGAIALQGVRQLQPTLGENFAVIGLGLLGQIATGLLAANGCRVLGVDIDPNKLPLAKEMGAEEAVGANWMSVAQGFSDGHGLDGILITASTKDKRLLNDAAEACRKRGRIVGVGVFGMEMERDAFYKKEIDFRMSCSYGPGRYDSFYEEQGHDYPLPYVRWTEQRNIRTILDLIAAERLDVKRLITHRFPIVEALDAYSLVRGERKEPYLGITLNYAKPNGENFAVERTPVILDQKPRSPVDGKLGVGVCGAGNFASGVMLPAVSKAGLGELVGIVSAAGLRARHLGKKFGFRYVSTDLEHLLSDPAIHAVFLLTRHDVHASQIVKSLEAGKHVFVEKPLAIDEIGLRDVMRAYNDNPGEVMVGYNRRFSSLSIEAKQHLDGAEGPQVMLCRINGGRIPDDSWIHDPKEGGGRIIGEVCHWISLMQYFCGADPISVSCVGVRAEAGWRTDDNISMQIQFSDGSIGTILYYACGNPQAAKEWVEVSRGGRMIQIDNWVSLARYGRKRENTRKLTQDKGFGVEVQSFLRSVRHAMPAPISFHESVMTTLATFAAMRSLENGEVVPVVMPSLDEEPDTES